VPPEQVKARHFRSAAAFRTWLSRHHGHTKELWILFHKKSSGNGGMGYVEAVEEALCWGWIDGVLRSAGDESFVQRFTPRRPGSTWSAVNIKRVAALTTAGRMAPPGIAAFEGRDRRKDASYLFERGAAAFLPEQERAFRKDRRAWSFWEQQPPGYRRLATHYVTSAKREETRARRLKRLMECSRDGCRLPGA
jgi:uncharacterized protein YdeI (YjbR/CyaY-like superfamily)